MDAADLTSLTILIPTLNAAAYLPTLLPYLPPECTLFIDSSSQDGTPQILQQAGFSYHQIQQAEFNHGKTRNLCLNLCTSDFVIFMTQDARPAHPDLFIRLLQPFQDPTVAATYARQRPHEGATILERLDRQYKYPNHDRIQSLQTLPQLGSQIIFLSNACAAYRLSIFRELGGFPETEIMGEDALFAYKAIMAGYQIIYTAEAEVFHSHQYSWIQLFKRYFDTGVYRSRQNFHQLDLGTQDLGRGSSYASFVVQELWKHQDWLALGKFGFHSMVSLIGYTLGHFHTWLPISLKKVISMHAHYWQHQHSDRSNSTPSA